MKLKGQNESSALGIERVCATGVGRMNLKKQGEEFNLFG